MYIWHLNNNFFCVGFVIFQDRQIYRIQLNWFVNSWFFFLSPSSRRRRFGTLIGVGLRLLSLLSNSIFSIAVWFRFLYVIGGSGHQNRRGSQLYFRTVLKSSNLFTLSSMWGSFGAKPWHGLRLSLSDASDISSEMSGFTSFRSVVSAWVIGS